MTKLPCRCVTFMLNQWSLSLIGGWCAPSCTFFCRLSRLDRLCKSHTLPTTVPSGSLKVPSTAPPELEAYVAHHPHTLGPLSLTPPDVAVLLNVCDVLQDWEWSAAMQMLVCGVGDSPVTVPGCLLQGAVVQFVFSSSTALTIFTFPQVPAALCPQQRGPGGSAEKPPGSSLQPKGAFPSSARPRLQGVSDVSRLGNDH